MSIEQVLIEVRRLVVLRLIRAFFYVFYGRYLIIHVVHKYSHYITILLIYLWRTLIMKIIIRTYYIIHTRVRISPSK